MTECFLTSFLRDRSLIDLQLLPGQWHSQPSLGSCTCEKMARSFMCHYIIAGIERTRNKSQYTKLSLENKILQLADSWEV